MPDIKLRPYQDECINTVNALPDGSRAIVALATGLGKTVCMSRFAYDKRMLILSHRDELVRQPEKYFSVPFGVEKASSRAKDEPVVSASVQSLSSKQRYTNYAPDAFDLIVVDEAHHAAAPSYREILDYFKPKRLIGLTATPKRGDNVRLDTVFDDICFSRDILWGVKNGFLCNIRCKLIESEIDISSVKMRMGDFNVKELAALIDTEQMYATVFDTYKRYCNEPGDQTIIYMLDKKSCLEMLSRFRSQIPEKADKFAVVLDDTKTKDRARIIDAYRNGEITCLINCMVLTEGFDSPNTSRIINARPTCNQTIYTQIVGRGTRLYPGKDHCLVLDIMPRTKRHICSSLSLAGKDWSMMTEEEKGELNKNGEIDLLDFAKEQEEKAHRRMRLASVIEADYDLFKGAIEKEREFFKKREHMTCTILAQEMAGQRLEVEQDALKEDGVEDTLNLHFIVSSDDERRYVFVANKPSETIYISKPNMLGKSTLMVEHPATGKVYKTTAVPVNKAFQFARNYLKRYHSSTDYTWNKQRIREWQTQNASERQIEYLEILLKNLNIHCAIDGNRRNITKYDCNVLIERLRNLSEMQSNLKILERNKDENRNRPIRPMEERPFSELAALMKAQEARDLAALKDIDFTFTVKMNPDSTWFAATTKQKSYIRSLVGDLQRNGAVLDTDPYHLGTYIKSNNSATIAIRVLSRLNNSSDIRMTYQPNISLRVLEQRLREVDLLKTVKKTYDVKVTVRYPVLKGSDAPENRKEAL